MTKLIFAYLITITIINYILTSNVEVLNLKKDSLIIE